MSVSAFNRWLNDMANKAEALEALHKLFRVEPYKPEDVPEPIKERVSSVRFSTPPEAAMRQMCPERVSPNVWNELIDRALHMMPFNGRRVHTSLSTFWTLCGLFAEGPKLYAPTLEEWEALRRVEMRIPLNMYRQPFPTLVVIVPEGAFPEDLSERFGAPAATIVRHWSAELEGKEGRGGMIAGLCIGTKIVDNGYELDFRISWCDDGESEMEDKLDSIDRATLEDQLNSSGVLSQMSGPERVALEQVKRAVFNAALLLSQHAPRKIGPANPAHAKKLEDSRKKKLPANISAANERALKLMPVYYGFHQHIKVLDKVTEPESNGTGTQPAKRPHWRRGHWLRQVRGTGRAERVLQYRPAKLVNEHLLHGSKMNTRVTMTTT